MRISLASVYVDDQDKALRFYTEVLGFQKQLEFPVEDARFITVLSPEGGPEVALSLEPSNHPAAKAYREALYRDGIPQMGFASDDIAAEVDRLKAKGVQFRQEITKQDWGTSAVFDDTCGNLIMLVQV